jgi:predicted metal-dependent enzyme (double-stranded beta helix superfamily)
MYAWRMNDEEDIHAMQMKLDILDHFMRWSQEIKALKDTGRQREFIITELPVLLKDKEIFISLLSAIINQAPYPDVRSATMFESEIVLYRDPDRMFSVRLYLWGQGDYDPIHDHNSWGVIGTALGTLDVINYKRVDDCSDERHAVLTERSRQFIPTGQTYSIVPLNKGIHQTGNANDTAIIQVGVYGRNLTGRDYVNVFDINTGEISRLYSPHVKKCMLARQALEVLGKGL